MFRKKVEERAAALYLLENPFFLKGEYEKVQFKKFEKLRKQLIIMYKGMVRDNFPQK